MSEFNRGLEAARNRDFEQAFTIWLPLAEDGNPYAQVHIGYMYLKGIYVELDLQVSNYWFEKASNSKLDDIDKLIEVFETDYEIDMHYEFNKGSG